jgi:hypothetical protein
MKKVRNLSTDSDSTGPLEQTSAEPSTNVETLQEMPGDYWEEPDVRNGYVGPDYSCCDECGSAQIGCGSAVACSSCGPSRARLSGGFAFTFLKPHYSDNLALTVMESDGTSFQTFSPMDFSYDTELTPRVWLEYGSCDGPGMRVRWWQFDHAADAVTADAPANGFGQVFPPPFGNIDISINVPGQSMTATTDLDAYTIDTEGIIRQCFGPWQLEAAGGVRFAEIRQHYLVESRDDDATLLGSIDFDHSFRGVGPTIALEARRCVGRRLGAFANLRGSLLFGEAESSLVAGEDLDLAQPFTTRENTARDDLLPIGELQIGLDWHTPLDGSMEFFSRFALEGHLWQDAGNATSEDGDLGFFGFSISTGLAW